MAEEPITLRVRLQGYAQAIRQSYQLAAATAAMGTAAETAGHRLTFMQRRGFLANQMIFTLRRYIYQATLALTALGGVAGFVGLKFNATVERTTIALDYLSKGQFNASDQMKEFLRIARDTAFLPQQVIDIGQSFIAFGFTAEETNRTLRATADAIAALNLPQATIDRVLFALGQMRVKGRVMGEELRQLANANIPAYQYLADALGKNVTELNRIGDARIPAEVGIEAILRGIEKQYGGASERIRETVSGQLEILKGDMQAILGASTLALFNALGIRLERITDVTGKMFEAVLEGGSFYDMVAILDEATGGAYHLVTAVDTLNNYFKALKGNIILLIDVAKPFVQLALLLVWGILELSTVVLNFIHLGGQPLVWILRLIVAWMIIERITLKSVMIWHNRAAIMKAFHVFWTKKLVLFTILSTFWRRKEATATRWATLEAKHQAIMEARRARILKASTVATTGATASTWAFTTALLANPLTWVLAGIVALVAGLVVLWWKFKELRPVIERVLFFITPLTAVFLFLARNIDKATAAAERFLNIAKKLDIENFLPDFFQLSGLDIARGIAPYVGFGQGPDLGTVAAGSPVEQEYMNWDGARGAGVNVNVVPTPVNIDGREVAEIVFKHRADRFARR